MDVFTAGRGLLAQGYLCDNCLGRQFAQLLSGFTNAERGRALRLGLAMECAAGKTTVDERNFLGINLRRKEKKTGEKTISSPVCILCFNLFSRLGEVAEGVGKEVRGYEFSTFAVGTKVRGKYASAEEKLWEEAGTEWCEPLRAEVNRELGKVLERGLGKRAEEKNPEMMITFDVDKNTVSFFPRSLYIYGGYKKLVRGISQSKWEKYPDSVEAQIARPFVGPAGASGHALHAAGREDVDARCLDWRPFVLELEQPKRRDVDLRKGAALIKRAGKVVVKDLRMADKQDVIAVKTMQPDKTYRVLARFEKPVTDLGKLKALEGTISQQTPTRVMHRRADLIRKKKVKRISVRLLTKTKAEITITGQAGLYAKELVTGDNGRTKPSVAGLLENKAKVLALDVIKIHGK